MQLSVRKYTWTVYIEWKQLDRLLLKFIRMNRKNVAPGKSMFKTGLLEQTGDRF